MGQNIFVPRGRQSFLITQEETIKKNKKLGFIKYITSHQKTLKKNRQSTGWQKIFRKYTPAKDLYPE